MLGAGRMEEGEGEGEGAVLHVEVALRGGAGALGAGRRAALEEEVRRWLRRLDTLSPGATLLPPAPSSPPAAPALLASLVRCVQLCDAGHEGDLCPQDVTLRLHLYSPDTRDPATDNLPGDGDEPPAATYWTLPSDGFLGLWESLVYDVTVKEELLRFVETTLLFSDRSVDSTIINWNRVVLLHGPPGTGKTSLCKALAQKLSIRLGERYRRTQLVEINSHSLFSKWFSESGKLVMKLFDKIREIIEDEETLVCVLIDEVESLTHARKSALSGLEPSDSIRVVNAVLTQIDQIQKYPNVLMMTTSNMTGAIDLAFVDRADIKRYIGLPSPPAIYQIYHSCISELMKAGIIVPTELIFTYKILHVCGFKENNTTRSSLDLLKVAKLSKGLSGRSLRKIPFLAHALFVNQSSIDLDGFLDAMTKAVKQRLLESDYFEKEMGALKLDNDSASNTMNGLSKICN